MLYHQYSVPVHPLLKPMFHRFSMMASSLFCIDVREQGTHFLCQALMDQLRVFHHPRFGFWFLSKSFKEKTAIFTHQRWGKAVLGARFVKGFAYIAQPCTPLLGVCPSLDRVSAVQQFFRSLTVGEVRVKWFASIAQPLHSLTKANCQVEWSPECIVDVPSLSLTRFLQQFCAQNWYKHQGSGRCAVATWG